MRRFHAVHLAAATPLRLPRSVPATHILAQPVHVRAVAQTVTLACPVRYSERRGRRRLGRRMSVKKVQESVPTGAVAPQPVRPPPPWVPPRPAPPPVPAEDPVEYPSEDGIPMAVSLKHARWMIGCFRTLEHRFRGPPDVFVGIDMLVYYERGDNTVSVVPDVYVSFGVPQRDLPNYKVWEEGKPPDVVWEFGPPSSIMGDAREKKEKFRRMGVREYWLVDTDGGYHDRRLQGFALVDGDYVELPWEERPGGMVTVWSPVLQLEQRFIDGRLRFRDRKTGRYLVLPEEEERGALEEAESRAEREAQACKQEAQARKQAESRADREAQARKAEMRKRKALEARVAELESKARPPRDPE